MPDESAGLLISLGDIWDATLAKARDAYGCTKVLAVKGNHDSATPFPDFVTDLHLSTCEHEGILFGGFKGSWKYKPRGHHLFEPFEVTEALRSFPRVNVFVAHNSPRGYHERDSEVHQGFQAFTDYIDRAQPEYFIHGHQHCNQVSQRGGTTIVGVYGETVLELGPGRESRAGES
jgi:Icc-related predicted phosphoesterase